MSHAPLTRAEQRQVVGYVEDLDEALAARLDADLELDPNVRGMLARFDDLLAEQRLLRESTEAAGRENRVTQAKELRANRLSMTAVVLVGMALNAALNGVVFYWSSSDDGQALQVMPASSGGGGNDDAAWVDTAEADQGPARPGRADTAPGQPVPEPM